MVHDHRLGPEYLTGIERLFPVIDMCPFRAPQEGYDPVYGSISSHPDIYLTRLDERTVICSPGIPGGVRSKLLSFGMAIIEGECVPRGKYPFTAAYNAARVGKTLFANTRSADKVLMREAVVRGLRIVHVEQGYSACSVVAVGDDGLITSDAGIAAAARGAGLDVLEVSCGNISLAGQRYGFLGGASGEVPGEGILFTGDLAFHPDGEAIKDFIRCSGMDAVSLTGLELVDCGKLFFFEKP